MLSTRQKVLIHLKSDFSYSMYKQKACLPHHAMTQYLVFFLWAYVSHFAVFFPAAIVTVNSLCIVHIVVTTVVRMAPRTHPHRSQILSGNFQNKLSN